MTLKQLEYFLEIARMGSVSKAAQMLNISQPPLSMQLKALEEELGVSLFNRTKRGLEITQEGLMLEERAKVVLAFLQETTEDLHKFSNSKECTLRIGSIGSINNQLLPNIISRFCRDYPYVNFQVHEGRTDTVLQDLHDGAIEFGFVREPFNLSGFRSMPIHHPALKDGESDYFAAIALPQFFDHYYTGNNAEQTIPLKELQGKPLVIHQRYRKVLVGLCLKQGFTPHIICENGEIQSSLSWAQAGIGIAIAPFTSASLNTDPRLIIRRLDSVEVVPQVCLVWNPTVPLIPEARAFMQML